MIANWPHTLLTALAMLGAASKAWISTWHEPTRRIHAAADDGGDPAPARAEDLAALNGVVERAVMTWQLAERVKRLSLPATATTRTILVTCRSCWRKTPRKASSASLPGMTPARATCRRSARPAAAWAVCRPRRQRGGVGSRLLDAAAEAARRQGLDGVLVRAQARRAVFRGARPRALADRRPAARLPTPLLAGCASGGAND